VRRLGAVTENTSVIVIARFLKFSSQTDTMLAKFTIIGYCRLTKVGLPLLKPATFVPR
jgi:hypothetical protein